MSKKILILSGSPRKNGNSDILCDEFAKGAIEAGHEVEKIRVAEKNIGYCRACYACRGTGVCAIKDDMEDILQKMIACDVILSPQAVRWIIKGTTWMRRLPHRDILPRTSLFSPVREQKILNTVTSQIRLKV